MVGRYLCEVSNIKQVKGFKQFTLFEMKLVLTNPQERADILQAQELNTKMNIIVTSDLKQLVKNFNLFIYPSSLETYCFSLFFLL